MECDLCFLASRKYAMYLGLEEECKKFSIDYVGIHVGMYLVPH